MPHEKLDWTEIEYKFPLLGPLDEDTLGVLRAALPPGLELTTLPSLAQLDLYLDTKDDFLLRSGATLRFRTSSSKRRISANFKPPRRPSDRLMVRREIRTSYLPAEAAAEWKADDHQGLAFREFAEFHKRETGGGSPSLGGVVWVESYRRRYVILPPERHPHAEPLIGILLDDVRVVSVDRSATDSLLLTRRLDVTRPLVEARFEVGEIESLAELCAHPDLSKELFRLLISRVEARLPSGPELRSKYQVARDLVS